MRKWRKAKTILLTGLATNGSCCTPAEDHAPPADDLLISNSPSCRRLFWQEVKSLFFIRRKISKNNTEKLTLHQVFTMTFQVVRDVLRRARVIQVWLMVVSESNKMREQARLRSEYEESLARARAAREASLRAKKEEEEAKQREVAQREAQRRREQRRITVAQERHREAQEQVARTEEAVKVEGIKRRYLQDINAVVRKLATSMAALKEMYRNELSESTEIHESIQAVRNAAESLSEKLAAQEDPVCADAMIELNEDEAFCDFVRQLSNMSDTLKNGSVSDVVSCLESFEDIDNSLSHLFTEPSSPASPPSPASLGQDAKKVSQPPCSIARPDLAASMRRKARPSPLVTSLEPHREEHLADRFDSGCGATAENRGDATSLSAQASSSTPTSPIHSMASTSLSPRLPDAVAVDIHQPQSSPLWHAAARESSIIDIDSPRSRDLSENFTADARSHQLQKVTSPASAELDGSSRDEINLPDAVSRLENKPIADRRVLLRKIRKQGSQWTCMAEGEKQVLVDPPLAGREGDVWAASLPRLTQDSSNPGEDEHEALRLTSPPATPRTTRKQQGQRFANTPAADLDWNKNQDADGLKKAFKAEIRRARDLKNAWQPPVENSDSGPEFLEQNISNIAVRSGHGMSEPSSRRCATLDELNLRRSMISSSLDHEPLSPKERSSATSNAPWNRAGRLEQNTSENSVRTDRSVSKSSSKHCATLDESNWREAMMSQSVEHEPLSPKERSVATPKTSWHRAWRIVSPVAAFQQLSARPRPAMLSEVVSPVACSQPVSPRLRPVTPSVVVGAEEAAIHDVLRMSAKSKTPDVIEHISAGEAAPSVGLEIRSISKGRRAKAAAKSRNPTPSEEISIEEVRCASKGSSAGIATKASRATSEKLGSGEETSRGGLAVTPAGLSPRPPSSERTLCKPVAANMARRYLT